VNQLTCQAVIFDLDGVLVDSTIVVEGTWRRWAAVHDLNFERVMQVAHGRPARDTVRLFAPHLDAEAEAARLAAEEAHQTDGLVRIEGAVQLINSLPKSRWAVVTSGTREIATTRLTFASVTIPAVLITAADVERGKPDPQAYTLAAERLGVPPESCIVIEDAPAGIQGARAAGMSVIAVAMTHPREALQDADVIVGCLVDIRASADAGCIAIFVGGDHAAVD
jgi:sugar-phosphatase